MIGDYLLVFENLSACNIPNRTRFDEVIIVAEAFKPFIYEMMVKNVKHKVK